MLNVIFFLLYYYVCYDLSAEEKAQKISPGIGSNLIIISINEELFFSIKCSVFIEICRSWDEPVWLLCMLSSQS